MQERRIISYFISEDQIPSSATPWDNSTNQSISGNTIYIPIYNNNMFISNVETGSSLQENLQFPFSIRGYSDQHTYNTVYNIATIHFDPEDNTVTSINDYPISGIQFSKILGIYRGFTSSSSRLTYIGPPFLVYGNTKGVNGFSATSYNTQATQFNPVTISPSIVTGNSSNGYAVRGSYGDGYIKINLSSSITLSFGKAVLQTQGSYDDVIPGNWEHPIYIDNE